ncbi:MAG: Gram-negative bacterial tonB protein [bacterium ADurb.Bin243]|nr:MAG: Gram-negative bacterial tonB protein [bacterium ADurb.Bin243]
MQEKRLHWLTKLIYAAGRIKKSFRENPEGSSMALSVGLHLLAFLMLSFYCFDYQGSIFGNGEEISAGENLIKVDFIAEEKPQSAASNSTYSKFAATSRLKVSQNIKKGAKAEAKTQRKQVPKALAAVKPETPAVRPDIKKEMAVIELNEKLALSETRKNIKAIEIPEEVSRQLDKKLKSTAMFEDNGQTSAEAVVKKVIEASDAIENISLSKTEVKTLDPEGEMIASAAVGPVSKPVSDIESDEDLIPEASSETASDVNANNSKNGSSSRKAKSGSGAHGKPSGKGQSGLVFEMVANSSYDEIPSFLNGPPAIDYPKWAQEQGVEGTVKILLEILPNGEVGTVSKFESPISDRLAQYLIKQSEMWRFKPIYKNGRPLSGTVMVAVDFALGAGRAN